MMSPAIEKSSPAEPQLRAITDWQPKSGSTDPSPLMPSLSPYPPTDDFCFANCPVLERKIPAKKMLDFGAHSEMRDQSLGDSNLDEDGESHTLGADTIQETFPRKLDLTPQKPTLSTSSTFASPAPAPNTPYIKSETEWTPALGPLSTPPQSFTVSPLVALKRPQSDTADEASESKRFRPGSSDESVSLEDPYSAENSHKDQLDQADVTGSDFKVPPRSDLFFSPSTVRVKLEVDTDTPTVIFPGEHIAAADLQGAAGDAEPVARDLENVLVHHGINIFDNPEHRRDLIRFCEQSLQSYPDEYTTDTNDIKPTIFTSSSNNNNRYGSIYSHNPTAHAQLESIVQRARARGYSVCDAVYFDGHQYVSIKVASNGRGKFRLLLPMDHPHRKGVAEEIPIFKMYEIDCSPDAEGEDKDEDEDDNSQTSEVDLEVKSE